MTDAAAIIASARMGWQLLAKIPWLTRLLLCRAFPISKCQILLAVDMPGNHARFELLRMRPLAALIGLEVRAHNHLPFDVEFELWRLTAAIDSNALLDATLNTRYTIPATGSARISLPEISLSDQQANWTRAKGDDCVRVRLELYWRCQSPFHDWQDQGGYESLIYLNRDRGEGARS